MIRYTRPISRITAGSRLLFRVKAKSASDTTIMPTAIASVVSNRAQPRWLLIEAASAAWPAAVPTIQSAAPSSDRMPSLTEASRSRSSGISDFREPDRIRVEGVDAGAGPISFSWLIDCDERGDAVLILGSVPTHAIDTGFGFESGATGCRPAEARSTSVAPDPQNRCGETRPPLDTGETATAI